MIINRTEMQLDWVWYIL